jgi:hypothetical protein
MRKCMRSKVLLVLSTKEECNWKHCRKRNKHGMKVQLGKEMNGIVLMTRESRKRLKRRLDWRYLSTNKIRCSKVHMRRRNLEILRNRPMRGETEELISKDLRMKEKSLLILGVVVLEEVFVEEDSDLVKGIEEGVLEIEEMGMDILEIKIIEEEAFLIKRAKVEIQERTGLIMEATEKEMISTKTNNIDDKSYQ